MGPTSMESAFPMVKPAPLKTETSLHLVMSKFVFAGQCPDMPLGLLLFQNATPSPAISPEKSPAWLTFVYLLGLALIALLLITSLLRVWLSRPATAITAPANLPKDIRNRL